MTNSQKRTLEIPLAFLGDGAYDGKLFVDAPNADRDPTALFIREIQADKNTTLPADLAPAGGLASWFRRR